MWQTETEEERHARIAEEHKKKKEELLAEHKRLMEEEKKATKIAQKQIKEAQYQLAKLEGWRSIRASSVKSGGYVKEREEAAKEWAAIYEKANAEVYVSQAERKILEEQGQSRLQQVHERQGPARARLAELEAEENQILTRLGRNRVEVVEEEITFLGDDTDDEASDDDEVSEGKKAHSKKAKQKVQIDDEPSASATFSQMSNWFGFGGDDQDEQAKKDRKVKPKAGSDAASAAKRETKGLDKGFI
eukprot:gnl/MRDRNA2_/MRDRNA2_113351_c0_seq1.p1 gnl/MRDRNA2_/MRDRNA2_113351_c0~~gnl/MRDRNA2_/MRDRNA2_113351_c0_seq1.p1  ORF type:complete len:246 (+),score=99.93 gnl/MRDRNA2_/MRDRNA2_113351_c0_seq1:116-853(+)